MATSFTITTDEPALALQLACVIAGRFGGDAPEKPKASRTATPPAQPAATVMTPPVDPALVAAINKLPPAGVTAAPPAAPAAEPVAERLRKTIVAFLKSPGCDAAKAAEITRKYTSKSVVGKDGVERKSANRADVPDDKAEACIAEMKTHLPADVAATL